ncbi:N-acetyllactosaminide beta-1,3-N-acetylglucosaminyltransferase 3 [Pangasianodon hypophthalmus]|uniref:N-acetyllactosaminide beta-1,3-N-acetylglucosaminyltransferase 3 n=1 Tax=Pangasianodon hypophthalmus TaxID=310915 RepID=UPI0023077167|nr:N-acetyllactosaminide beta-1,3-N-acetylglucosaminyltransferase 3 [Pangasianodon hypophthalmus]
MADIFLFFTSFVDLLSVFRPYYSGIQEKEVEAGDGCSAHHGHSQTNVSEIRLHPTLKAFPQGLYDNDGSKHLFIGHFIENMDPVREQDSKYYVPVQVYESDKYPPYCSGGGFLLSRFTSRTIYNMSHSITLVPIDDVYMGMCLEKAGLKPSSHMGVKPLGLNIPSVKLDPYNPCYYREVLLVHRFLPHQIFIMWNEIHRQDLVCGKKALSEQNDTNM